MVTFSRQRYFNFPGIMHVGGQMGMRSIRVTPPSHAPRGGYPSACPYTLSMQRHVTLYIVIGIFPGRVKKRYGRRARPKTQGSGSGPGASFCDRLGNSQKYCSEVWRSVPHRFAGLGMNVREGHRSVSRSGWVSPLIRHSPMLADFGW